MESDARKPLIDFRDTAAMGLRKPFLIAHRGGVITPDSPENTLAAIRLAARCGYNMVELDVIKPKDDEPVLFHDRTGSLLMNCGVDAPLVAYTAKELTAINYRASAQPIATLAQALALCRQLALGVMLDVKERGSSEVTPGFVRRIEALLREYDLFAATIAISGHPLLRESLDGRIRFPITETDLQALLRDGRPPSHGAFWFGIPEELPEALIAPMQNAGLLVIPAINTFRYPPHAHAALARADIERLRRLGADGFQIDSVYGALFGLDLEHPA